MSQCLLAIIAAPQAEDALVDWLLTRAEVDGFTSLGIDSHASSHRGLTLAEQVSGRQRKLMFQIHLPCDAAHIVIEALKRDFVGSGLHYWLTPVMETGRLD
ncbi:MAG: DUF3240 family protein [Pseudomonadota bacterium]